MHPDLPNKFDAVSISVRRMMTGLEAVGTSSMGTPE